LASTVHILFEKNQKKLKKKQKSISYI